MVRRRQTKQSADPSPSTPATLDTDDKMPSTRNWSTRTQWIFFAMASGACAAFNGVFAKLTTTELTSSLSKAVAGILGLSSAETVVEVAVRAIFFVLNLVFNGVMWSLFTTALARGTSTTQVSIMNTSTNFIITALLGLMIFSESLPPMWWAGAALLVAGSVITGRKEGEEANETSAARASVDEYATVPQQDRTSVDDGAPPKYGDGRAAEDEDIIDLADLSPESSHRR